MTRTLRKKAAIVIINIAVLLSAAALVTNYFVIKNMVESHYKEHTVELSSTAAGLLDVRDVHAVRDRVLEIYAQTENKVGSEDWGSPEFNEYVSHFDEVRSMTEYNRVLSSLRMIQNRNDVDCVYLVIVVPEDRVAVYLVDAAMEDACMPGVFDPLYDINADIIDDPGRGFPPYITKTEEYGWLVTGGVPVYDGNEVVGYCLTDIPMNNVMGRIARYTLYTAALLLALTLIMIWVAMFIIERSVVRPIRQLSDAAKRYSDHEVSREESVFSDIETKTGDEIQELSESIRQMESDMHEYFDNLLATKQELLSTREHADNMDRLANLDGLTGVRNKRAYENEAVRVDEAIKAGKAIFGIIMIDMNNLKETNDLYGHEKGDVAIIQLCNLICGIFMHSPVFRFGGDEFVVLLEKRDYYLREDLIRNFERLIDEASKDDSLEPWERMSAALGCAIYYPGEDMCTDDVFARADAAMYKRKKEMKGELA